MVPRLRGNDATIARPYHISGGTPHGQPVPHSALALEREHSDALVYGPQSRSQVSPQHRDRLEAPHVRRLDPAAPCVLPVQPYRRSLGQIKQEGVDPPDEAMLVVNDLQRPALQALSDV